MPSRNENRIIRKNEVRNDGRDRMITDRKDAALSGNFPGYGYQGYRHGDKNREQHGEHCK